MAAFLTKETLFWVPYSVDLILCLIQFPMFAIKGPEWVAKTLSEQDGEGGSIGSTKKDDDQVNHPVGVTPAYAQLYDLFLLCYSGYCFMMYYSLYSVVAYPAELMPVLGSVMLVVNVAKVLLMWRWEKRVGGKALQKSKKNSLFSFNLPTYGGYCLVCFLQWYKAN